MKMRDEEIEVENVRFAYENYVGKVLKFDINSEEYLEYYDSDREKIGRSEYDETKYLLSEHFEEDEIEEILDQLHAILNMYKEDAEYDEENENSFKM